MLIILGIREKFFWLIIVVGVFIRFNFVRWFFFGIVIGIIDLVLGGMMIVCLIVIL